MEGVYKGKIRCVIVNNFITYNAVKIYFGPYLNVILGPNGCGKSTIVAAIVIAMGGSCNTLARGKQLKDFIKNGTNKAAIAVEIYEDDAQNTVEFYRSFDDQNNLRFKVNKKKVSQKAYMERVRAFNIQVDNLCQFLPQDRVQDFSKLNPQELFVSTLKSVCDEEMQQMYQELLAMEKQASSSGTELGKWRTDLKEAQTQNDQLRVKIANMEMHSRLQEMVQVGKMKKLHLQAEELTGKMTDCKKDCETAVRGLKDKQKLLEPIKKESEQFLQQIRKLDADITTHRNGKEKISAELSKLDAETEKIEEEVREARQNFRNAKRQKESQEEDIINCTNILSGLVGQLQAAAENKPEIDRQKSTLQAQVKTLREQDETMMRERLDLTERVENQIQTEMQRMTRLIAMCETPEQQHLEALKLRHPDMYRATMWLRENRQIFSGRIYDPIALELKVKNKDDAKFLENTISVRDFTAFLCEKTEDAKKLIKKLTHEMKLKVNIVQSDTATQVNYKPNIPIDEIRRFGFRQYLLDMVEGPCPILNFLCQVYNLHNIPVGDDSTDEKLDEVTEWGRVQLLFTRTHRFSLAKSRYSSATTTTCTEISGKGLLSTPTDQSKLRSYQEKLQELTKLRDEQRSLISQYESRMRHNAETTRELQVRLRDVVAKGVQIGRLQQRVQEQKEQLNHIQGLVIDLDVEKRKYQGGVKASLKKSLALQLQKVDKMGVWKNHSKQLALNREMLKKVNESNSDLKRRLCDAEGAVANSQSLVDQIKGSLEGIKKRIVEKRNEIKALQVAMFPADMKYEEHEHFRAFAATMDQLEEQLDALQAQVDCMEGHNEAVIAEYEAREKTIEELREKIKNSSAQHQDMQKRMSEMHKKWFPAIEEIIIGKISRKFSLFLASMSYAGDLGLTRKDDYQYSSYGIEIMVMFRNTETLQRLNRFVQSGGERTVAIATFTLAMQQLNQVPFRCVDEINQGMDPKNERKIFELLVDETAQPGMCQYIFVTPKLLPNLRANEHVTFHTVFNGPYIRSAITFLPADPRTITQAHQGNTAN
ncbi:structural maintenance of chromosomes protein 5 [Phlebotomus argentipes]|uniref:structural maintenance of chromosomes protein 5 n=1 Tax=Phlebotomus argentipes TaxID=94469 RepID=UPI002892C5DE|nr:structural maintenance of chromosomes protein 5 [Phlebotomus argentipes]